MVNEKKLNIVIFGATGKIGDYLLNKFYKKKCNLLLYSRNKKKINLLKRKFKPNQFQQVFFEQLNFESKNDLKKKIIKHKNFLKKTDIIINTIGIQGEIKNFFNLDLKKFYKTFNINFFSHVILFRNLFKIIKKNKDTLLAVFSGGGVTSLRKNFSSYSLSKIALVKLVEILSSEFQNKNLRINAIAPGIINSKMTRLILTKRKKLVSNNEIKKIKKEIIFTDKSLNKVYELIMFLAQGKGKKITGKIISSRWDDFKNWNKTIIQNIAKNDIYKLRRIQKL
tara:strand:+ start:63 stop:905 length:843 start_codon:yes stop_codon:yes gene_type:complete